MAVIQHVDTIDDCRKPDNAERYRDFLRRRELLLGNDYPWPHLDPAHAKRVAARFDAARRQGQPA